VIQQSCDLETSAEILEGLGPQAPSIKQQAATFCRATKLIIDKSNKQQARQAATMLTSELKFKLVYNNKN
jgi:hypothetical protein